MFPVSLNTQRNILTVLFPGLILVWLFWVAPQRSAIPQVFMNTHEYLPYLIIVPTLMLCFAFRLTREFNQLLLLGIIHWTLVHYVWHNPYQVQINRTFLIYAISILLPLNIFAHNLLKERGIISRHGLWRLFAGLMQILFIMLLVWAGNKTMHRPFNITLVPALAFKGVVIPQVAQIGFLLAAILIAIRSAMNTTILNLNQIVFTLACLLAMQFIRNELYGTLFLSLAATATLFAILLNSYSLAYLDELTGLPSRRALKQSLSALGKNYSVAMLDIDHFKKLNDTYGHDVGDQVLKMVASRIRQVPGASKAFRYGGEEFTVLFPGKTLSEAHANAQEICKAVAQTPFALRSKGRPRKKPRLLSKPRITKKIKVTISIGVAQKTGRHKTADDTIKSADKALYKAKESGRNRACT